MVPDCMSVDEFPDIPKDKFLESLTTSCKLPLNLVSSDACFDLSAICFILRSGLLELIFNESSTFKILSVVTVLELLINDGDFASKSGPPKNS